MRLFKPKTIGYGEGVLKPSQWGIIIPHSITKQGALAYNGISEYYYACRIGQTVLNDGSLPHGLGVVNKRLSEIFPIETRNKSGVSGAAHKLAHSHSVNASLEPHFNSFNGKVSGAEILVLDKDYESIHKAEMILEYFSVCFPERRVRGVKKVKKGDRGYKNLRDARKHMDVSLLSELFFGDNHNDYMEPETQAKFWAECLI